MTGTWGVTVERPDGRPDYGQGAVPAGQAT